MTSVRISQDVVAIGKFKGHAARWLRRVADTGHPVVITLNGLPAGVLVSPCEFDRLMERQRLLESIAAGLADAETGRVATTEEVEARLSARREVSRCARSRR